MDLTKGDRLQLDRLFKRPVTAVVVEAILATGVWRVLVQLEDTGEYDVWVWNQYQFGKSIHKIGEKK